jgi:hypothetical protein
LMSGGTAVLALAITSSFLSGGDVELRGNSATKRGGRR